MADVDTKKREDVLTGKRKSDETKNYVIAALAILAGILLYLQLKKGNVEFIITGQQWLLGCIVVASVLYWLFRDKGIPELPTKDKIAIETADWHWTHNAGLIDYTQCEVYQLSDQRALVYVPTSGKTFTYQAGKGIIEERFRDIESEIKGREDGELIKALNIERQKSENLKKTLQDSGIVPEEQ